MIHDLKMVVHMWFHIFIGCSWFDGYVTMVMNGDYRLYMAIHDD